MISSHDNDDHLRKLLRILYEKPRGKDDARLLLRFCLRNCVAEILRKCGDPANKVNTTPWTESTTVYDLASWWPREGAPQHTYRRCLDGEIHLKEDLKPTTEFAHWRVEVSGWIALVRRLPFVMRGRISPAGSSAILGGLPEKFESPRSSMLTPLITVRRRPLPLRHSVLLVAGQGAAGRATGGNCDRVWLGTKLTRGDGSGVRVCWRWGMKNEQFGRFPGILYLPV